MSKNVLATICFVGVLTSSLTYAENTSYYIDAQKGSDAADGCSEKNAWKTLKRAGRMTFGPGDRLFLKAGGRWVGQLKLKGSGTKEKPVLVGRYGEGQPPHIAGEGKASSAVVLQNGSHWVIEGLEVTNAIPHGKRRNNMKGVLVEANSGGVFENIVLRRLHVHHVSGAWDRQGGSGIWVGAEGDAEDGSTRKSRYGGVRIEDCYIHDVSFYGIMVSGWANRFRDNRWYPSTNVVARNNFTHDTGGDSIVVIACDKPLIEHNEGHRSAIGQSKGGKTHAAGMWPHSSDGTVMRYNKVVGIDAKKDGQAFDVDINCRNTLIEYNWSEKNTSGFLLVCSPTREVPGTSGIIVRNNVSINDGAGYAVLKLVSDVRDVTIENNLFLNRSTKPQDLIRTWRPKKNKGWTTDVLFRNNIFSSPGKFVYKPASFVVPTFKSNTYAGEFQDLPKGTNDIQVKHPAVRIDAGKVVPTHKDSAFKPFDISKAGLLPTSSWLKERDASLAKTLKGKGYSPAKSGYQLVYQDEFNDNSLNTKDWYYRIP